MGEYARPTNLATALQTLQSRRWFLLAGGTDFYPARVGQPLDENVLDVSAIAELAGIIEDEASWRIGARVTWSELLEAPLPPYFDGLKLAAREVGGVQIQNAGTIVGNLCNASPAADGVPPLLAMAAEIEVAGADGTNRLPIDRFILGNRRTALKPGQMVTGIVINKPESAETRSHFLKLGARKYLVISIVMTAAAVELDGGNRIQAARIAVGACSEVASRLPELEAAIIGQEPGPDLGDCVTPAHLAALSPIDDVRATASYRCSAARQLVAQMLNEMGAAA